MNFIELSKSSVNLVTEFPKEYRNKILKLALSSYLPTAQDRFKIIDNLSKDSNIPTQICFEVLGAYITLLGIFLQCSDNEFKEKLMEFGFTSTFLESLPFLGNREEIIDNLQKSYGADFGKLSLFKWKIDISLGNSDLAKKVPNFILLSLSKKNATKFTIELDPQMFHKLRFSIALILSEFNNLKNK